MAKRTRRTASSSRKQPATRKSKSASRTGRSSKKKQATRTNKKPKDIQTEVRDLTLKAISERNLTLEQLSDLAGAVLGGATTAMKNVLPASRKSALRQVLQGIDDAWAATAKASVSSIQHAKRYGLRFAKRDLEQLGKRLSSLERDFVRTVDEYARRLGGEIGRELNSVTGQIRKAGTEIRPAAQAAQKAITEHGTTLVREAASVGAKAGKQALHGVLLAASGVLEGAGRAVNRTDKRRTKSK